MRKLAFFDFCGTLVSFQTADAYVDYVRNINGNCRMKFLDLYLKSLIRSRLLSLFNKYCPAEILPKKLKLLQLKGFNFEDLNNLAESYYEVIIKPQLLKSVVTEMQSLMKKDYEICIVSAGYSLYLRYFAMEHQIKHIISTEISFNKSTNLCLGTFSGKDCINVEKVNRIKAYFANQDVNYGESISYSDSISDLPMLLLTGRGVVVSRNYSQKWSRKYKFEEIIWT